MRYQLGLVTVVSALVLGVVPPSASGVPATNPAGGPAAVTAETHPAGDAGRGAQHRSERAEAALERAEGLFVERRPAPRVKDDRRARRAPHAGPGGAGPGSTAAPTEAEPVNATPVLRDLALAIDDLDPEGRTLARRILARPTDGARDPGGTGYPSGTRTDHACAEETPLCVHWVTEADSVHAPPLADADEDGVPDWVEQNRDVFAEVWQRIVGGLGYRAPLPDDGAVKEGPDRSTDVYLAELGRYGMYGYCTIDRPDDRAAYCVVDNDFADYSARPAEQSLRVTAAHELFHAVQFAYRVDADYWLMEGTATWVEDEVYDDIDDNLRYLRRSPLRVPTSPLDYVHPFDYDWDYGSWIWWRFLEEYLPSGGVPDPSVVREVWQRVASDGPRQGTLQAVRRVVAAHGGDFARAFADFGAMNRIPNRFYDEGASYLRYAGPPQWNLRLTRARRSVGWREARLGHLSSAHAVLRPGTGLAGPWRLRVVLDLPTRTRGAVAGVVVHRRDGSLLQRRLRLDRRGDAQFTVPFDRRVVGRVAVTLTNASTRFRGCGGGTLWTCGGTPVDDDLRHAFRATALRRG